MDSQEPVIRAYLPGEVMVMGFPILGYRAVLHWVEASFTSDQTGISIVAEGPVSSDEDQEPGINRQVARPSYEVTGEDTSGFYRLKTVNLVTSGGRNNPIEARNLGWEDVGFRVDDEPNIGPTVRIMPPDFYKGS